MKYTQPGNDGGRGGSRTEFKQDGGKNGGKDLSWANLITNKNFVILLVAGVFVSGLLLNFGRAEDAQTSVTASAGVVQPAEISQISALERDLENKLEANLSQMAGVGQVSVSVSFSSGLKSSFAKNESITQRTSKETDNAGGTRETTEVTENNQLVMPNGASLPVIVMEERPEVAGVLVIAEGAKDPGVKEAIHNAVKTLLDIPSTKITVEAMEGI